MIALDKIAHIFVGAVIALGLGYVLPAWVGFVVAAVIGLLKEVYDYYHPKTHTCDGMDFLATAGGGLAAVLYVIAVGVAKV